ncbi:hypothetical protein D3C81_308460 [compost metagenome]
MQRTLSARFGAEFLRNLFMVGNHVSRFHDEGDEARAHRRRIHGAIAAIDVGAAVEIEFFVAGDRVQGHAGQVPFQPHAAALGFQVLAIDAVRRVVIVIKAVDQVVRALLEYVGAEEGGRAIEVARVHVEQGGQVARGLDQHLQAGGAVFIAFEVARAGGAWIVYAVVAALRLAGKAQGQRIADGHVESAFQVFHAILAETAAQVAFCPEHGLGRIELDHAGRRVAAEQGALRPAQHFHLVHVKHGKTFQHGVFLHHVIHHQAHRLRGIQVEVGIAQAANIEARESAAIIRFDGNAGRAAIEKADVGAAGRQGFELVTLQGGDRHGHVLDVFRAPLRRDDDGFQLAGARLRGGCRRGFGGRCSSAFLRLRQRLQGECGRNGKGDQGAAYCAGMRCHHETAPWNGCCGRYWRLFSARRKIMLARHFLPFMPFLCVVNSYQFPLNQLVKSYLSSISCRRIVECRQACDRASECADAAAFPCGSANGRAPGASNAAASC